MVLRLSQHLMMLSHCWSHFHVWCFVVDALAHCSARAVTLWSLCHVPVKVLVATEFPSVDEAHAAQALGMNGASSHLLVLINYCSQSDVKCFRAELLILQ